MSTFKCHVCGGETARDEFASAVLDVDGRRVLVLEKKRREMKDGGWTG